MLAKLRRLRLQASSAASSAATSVQYTSDTSVMQGSRPSAAVDLSDAVLHAIIESGGNIRLAQERLVQAYPNVWDQDNKPQLAELAQHLEGHQAELKERMELVQLLELFSLLPQLRKTLTENLSSLSGNDAVGAYMKLHDLIGRAVKKDELQLNINDMRWKLVPRDLAQIYAELEATGQLQQVIEHSPENDGLTERRAN